MKYFVLFLFVIFSSISFGQQLVYKPINPSFVGGDPFNGSWLLNSANAQNSFEDNSAFAALDRLGGGDKFGFNQFGGNNIPPEGTSIEGDFQYEVFESSNGLVINVLNIITGEATQIIIPN